MEPQPNALPFQSPKTFEQNADAVWLYLLNESAKNPGRHIKAGEIIYHVGLTGDAEVRDLVHHNRAVNKRKICSNPTGYWVSQNVADTRRTYLSMLRRSFSIMSAAHGMWQSVESDAMVGKLKFEIEKEEKVEKE